MTFLPITATLLPKIEHKKCTQGFKVTSTSTKESAPSGKTDLLLKIFIFVFEKAIIYMVCSLLYVTCFPVLTSGNSDYFWTGINCRVVETTVRARCQHIVARWKNPIEVVGSTLGTERRR